MIDTQARPKSYLRLIGLVTLLGIVSAVITLIFMGITHLGADFLWHEVQPLTGLTVSLFTLLICMIGGLLVGLLVKLFGVHTGILAEVMLEFGKTGKFDYRTVEPVAGQTGEGQGTG
jgi:hypothetical protein